MPKRKVISESDKAPKKKLKSDSNVAPKTFISKLSFDSPEQCLRSLIYPTTLEDFLAKYWEKEPHFVRRNDKEYFKDFLTKEKLEETAKKEHLEWGKDLYLSLDEEATQTPEASGKATVKSIQKYLKEKLTVLLNKPHRFHDELYELLKLLEEYFGCCVYCSLEIHTEDAYGRKPGYMGKEQFILQTEGKKRWCLFKPIKELAYVDSEDLAQDEVGGVTHEFTLEAGDLLYFPRGTVYQAHNVPGEVSSYIAVELYEEYNWGHFLSNILDKAVNEALEKDVTFREGLPINFLSYMGFGKKEFNSDTNGNQNEQSDETPKAIVPKISKVDLNKQTLFQEKLQKMVSSLGQYLDPHWGADVFFGKTFMAERLPPTDDDENKETEQPPTDESVVQLKHTQHIRITFYDAGEDEDASDESIEDDVEEEKDEDSEKKNKKSQKDSKSKGEKKSQKFKSDIKEKKEDEDEKMASDEDEKMDSDGEELDESFQSKPCLFLYHSLNNNVNSDDEEDLDEEDLDEEDHEKESKKLKFPVHYRDALLILHRSSTPVAVRDLPLTSEERVELAVTLWCEGLLTEKS